MTPSSTQTWNTHKYDMLMKVRHPGDAPMDILIGHGYLGVSVGDVSFWVTSVPTRVQKQQGPQ